MTTDCYYSPCRIIIFHAMLSTMLRVIIFDNTRDKYLKRIKKNISDKKISIINPIRIAKKKKTIDHSRRYVISIKHFLIRIQTSPLSSPSSRRLIIPFLFASRISSRFSIRSQLGGVSFRIPEMFTS